MSFGAAPPGMDEYQRLMAERNAANKRKRLIFGVVAIAAVGGGYLFWSKEAGKKKQAQAILDAGGKLAMADKADMGQFWSCVFGTDTDVGMFQSGDQIQQRIESAYFTQKATYSEHLTTDCVPKLEGARSAISGIEKDMLPALKPPYDKYVASLPKMQAGIESYAEKLKSRGSVKDVDQSIQEVGGAFSTDVTPESVAFEKFLVCAIPGLDKMKDVQSILEFIAKDCKKDPVPFMTRIRTECGALVQKVDKDAKPSPSKTLQGELEEVLRRGSTPATSVVRLRQVVAQGQEAARPRRVHDGRQRLHRGARRVRAHREGRGGAYQRRTAARGEEGGRGSRRSRGRVIGSARAAGRPECESVRSPSRWAARS